MSNSCELHLVSNCQLCAKAKPVVQQALNTVPPAQPSPANAPTLFPAQPPPVFSSDPHAAKVLAAAKTYADLSDSYKTISDEVKQLEQKIYDAKKRMATAATSKDESQSELMKLMSDQVKTSTFTVMPMPEAKSE